MSTPCFYTNQKLLPQSQSPEQLSAWLSGKHPGYDLVAWCFYGNLISKAEGSDKVNVDAVAYLTSFIQSPTMPQLEGIGIRPFQSSFSYVGSTTNGYLVSGDTSPTSIPAVTVTQKPWSVVVSYKQGTQYSTNCISVIDGEMGSVGAKYMLTADAACTTTDKQTKRLRAEITIVDKMGIVGVGYGPCSFSPAQGQFSPDQVKAIVERYDGSVADYLEKTNTPMTNQGSYYYSAPLLEVKSFKIIGEDDAILSEGNQGTLWMDYAVQSFDKKEWHSSSGATWKWFAIQFPEKSEALVVSLVEFPSSPSPFPVAMLFNTTSSKKMANGALIPKKEWKMSEISLSPDCNSVWTSTQSKKIYYTRYTVSLGPLDSPAVTLSIKSVRKDQEIYVHQRKIQVAKYEGVFHVSGTINGEEYNGYAWGEVNTTNSGSENNQQCCKLI